MQYQNLFTRVQATGPLITGVPLPDSDMRRIERGFFLRIAGWIGNAQIGPFYLGGLGIASLLFGTLAFNIIGFNMLAQVDWNPVEFVRQLFWLALEPPPPAYGLRFPPMNQGGWWLLSGLFLTVSLLLWWARTYRRARALGVGTHVAWAFMAASLFVVLILYRREFHSEVLAVLDS